VKNKNNIYFCLIAIFMLLFTVQGALADNITGFSTRVIYNSSNYFPAPTSTYTPVVNASGTILTTSKFYYPNLSYQTNSSYLDTGKPLYLANGYLYDGTVAGLSRVIASNGTIMVSGSGGGIDAMFSYLSQPFIPPYTNNLPFSSNYVTPTNGAFKIVNASFGGVCSSGSYGALADYKGKLLYADSDYIFEIRENTSSMMTSILTVYDYACNIVSRTQNVSSALGINMSNSNEILRNVMYSETRTVFLGTSNQHILMFDNTGFLADTEYFGNVGGVFVGLNITGRSKCVYSSVHEEYDCIVNDSLNNMYLMRVPLGAYSFNTAVLHNLSSHQSVGGLNVPGSLLFKEETTFLYVVAGEPYIITNNRASGNNEEYVFSMDRGTSFTTCTGAQYTGLSCMVNLSNQCECYSSTAYCLTGVDQGYFCGQPTYYLNGANVFGGGHCLDINYASWCSNGCNNTKASNVFGINYTVGVCSNSTMCTSDCSIKGQVSCTNTNTYATCDFYGGSACLSLGAFTGCPLTNGCVNGLCVPMNITPTEINRPLFSVVPDVVKTLAKNNLGINRNATVTPDYANNILYIKLTGSTVYLSASEFAISTALQPFSYALNTDYLESNVYSNTTSAFTNVSTELVGGFTSGFVEMNVLPYANGLDVNKSSILIIGYDNVNRVHFRLDLERNFNNNICLYKANTTQNDSQTYWCKSVTGNLKDITVRIQEIQQSGGSIVYAVETTIIPLSGVSTIVDTNLIATENSSASSLYQVTSTSIEGAGFNRYNFRAVNGQDYNLSWKNYNTGQIVESIFQTLGCRTLRFYGSDFILYGTPNPSFVNVFNTHDWKVCTSGVPAGVGVIPNAPNDPFGLDALSPIAKLLLGILIPLVVFAGCSVLGFMGGMPQIGLLLGAIFGIGGLIGMVALGWLDVWVLVLMIMVTGVASVLLYRVFLNGGGQ
jgi:hypothetical protein